MRTRRFGWTGNEVTVLGEGTWKMEGDDPDEAVAALQAGIDAGMTHVDTAELYGGGRVESQLVARAIAGSFVLVLLTSLMQSLLAGLGEDHAVYGALHALDGLLILGIAGYPYTRARQRES